MSVRAGQAENVLGHVGKNHIGRDGGHLVQAGLAEFAFDVVFAGKAETTMRLQTDIRRFPWSLGRKVLGHVGLRAGVLVRIDLLARLPAHQVGGFELDEGVGNGELHALVLANGTVEHHALTGVSAGAFDEPVAIADALGSDQGAFGVQAVE